MGQPGGEEVTQLMNDAAAAGPGSPSASELLELVYQHLRAVAQRQMQGERAGHTLQATALVHEAYVRLLGAEAASGQKRWAGRGQFYFAAAEAMRRILVEHARARGRARRGGDRGRVSLADLANVADLAREDGEEEIVAFDGAVRRLEEHDARMADVVRLRFFAGLSVEQTALALGVSERTVNNEWTYARAWLARELGAAELKS
jgi:RNA polymerase sigma factor (TIGR02999 family)